MRTKQPHLLGVSSYLHEGAIGHYLGVHSEYHKQLNLLSISNNYLGSDKGKGRLQWIDPVLSFIPTKLLNFDQKIKQIKLFFSIYKASKVDSKIFVFEGNLNYWLILCLITRIRKNTAHINLIRSDLIYNQLIRNNKLIYKMFFLICAHLGKNRVSVSTFSAELSKNLNDLYPINATQIPTFSGFVPKLKKNKELTFNSNVLIFAPYLQDINCLQKVLQEFPEIRKEISVSTWQPDNVVENLRSDGVKVVNSHLSDDEYELLLLNSSHVVLLYSNEFHKFGSSSKVYDCVMVNRNICVPNGTEVAIQASVCSNFYIFDHLKAQDIYKSIVNPVFVNNYNPSLVPGAPIAAKYLLSNNLSGKSRLRIVGVLLGILFYFLFLFFSLGVTSYDLFKRLSRKLFARVRYH